MGMMDSITKMIANSMDSPADRDAAFRAHMTKVQSGCSRVKAEWSQTMRTDGYWLHESRQLAHITDQDPAIKHFVGRRNILEMISKD
eukprot:CAMPEP_0182867224 /NCGR_PEP_ID=MMETSP0034_2-20130328/8607_1 /TAXON_ID=156128 /ORGANISM="Nephroselmis pyriformis, Strain CCMP717" /LENGTH=86 /DNA_ID=CAMNT_0024999567 /DNA_START=106 /DNA_END=366 /DNA_ORIENTATION=-